MSKTAIVLGALVASLACQRQTNEARPTNLVVVVTDTVRADHLGAHGYGRDTSRFFDAFARRSFWFENAYAPSSWTRPSVASLFTGTYPQTHGVQMRQDALGETLPTLASLLHARGAQTVMVTTNPHVTPTWRLTRGFDQTVELMPDRDQLKLGNDASVVFERLVRLLPTLREPFFLYLHLIDPHRPYLPPEEDLRALGVEHAHAEPADLYDGELRFADRYVARMLASLDDAALLDDTVVVLTADHGEELFDHGTIGHGHTLFEEVVRVPLALGVPARVLRGVSTCPRIRTNTSLVDLAPTLLSLLGCEPPPTMDGRDLSGALRCEPIDDAPLFFSVDKEQASLAAVLLGRSKLIVDRHTDARALFLLDDNPREHASDSLGDSGHRQLADDLGALLSRFEGSAQPGIHLDLVGVEGLEHHREKIQVQLSTTGRIVRATPVGLEPTDGWRVTDDKKSMWVDAWLTSVYHRAPKHIWGQDRDQWLLEIEPPDAPVTLSVRVDGRPADPAVVRTPLARGWPLTACRERLRRPDLVDGRVPGVHLYERQSISATATADLELRAALEALGYQH